MVGDIMHLRMEKTRDILPMARILFRIISLRSADMEAANWGLD